MLLVTFAWGAMRLMESRPSALLANTQAAKHLAKNHTARPTLSLACRQLASGLVGVNWLIPGGSAGELRAKKGMVGRCSRSPVGGGRTVGAQFRGWRAEGEQLIMARVPKSYIRVSARQACSFRSVDNALLTSRLLSVEASPSRHPPS